MAEVVCSALVGIGKCACPYLEEPMGYLMHFNDNVEVLKDRVEDLVARKKHIDQLVSPDHSNGEEETPEVRLWLTRAAEMIQEAGTIQQKVVENKGCLHCLNLKWRYSISKLAKQMTESIFTHIGKVNPDNMKMTMPQSLPTVIIEEAPSIQGLPSVESSLREVMSALRDENTKIIGVWGMGGVGKTTLVKNVNSKLDGTRQFQKVIMVTVSKDVDIKKIQGDIAKRLGSTLPQGTESERAIVLRSRLLEEETFLIILDDLWVRLDLAAVGIPSPTSHTGCKIIFTTRSKNVCNRMESKVNVLVNVLSEKESEKLFKEKAGDVVDDPSVRTKAMEVLKECAGLPLAITALGWALKDEKNPRVWEDALSQMKMSAPTDIKDMEKAVYQSIKFSYDRLQDKLKPLFLFCCLFPEDYDIRVDQMIHMWKGEGFLDDLESLEEAINRGHTWVKELKSSCLLLASTKEGHVKMHDIVRDVGIWISSNECKDCKSFVRIGRKGLPQGKSWEEYKRISLWRCGINKLPEGMHCPKLLTLMMPENEEPIEIQGWFLEAAKHLRVLDLSKTAISKLPLSNLVNLRVLCLRSCKFEEWNCLSALGGLKQLEFLDLSFNDWLFELPNEIGELVNLRSLDLTNTVHLKIVPSGVISRLTLLEELKMWNSFHGWKAEEKDASSSSSSNASLSEVASLKELSNLHLCIVERFPRDYPLIKHLRKLKKFCFRICPRPVYHSYPVSNPDELKYMELVGCSLIPEWALMLLPQTTHLKLQDCKGQEALNRGEGFPSLKSLTVEKCDDVEFVVSAKESPENAFGNLQSLELRKLPNLKKVMTKYEEGLLPTLLFHNLKEVEVNGCPELKHLLPSALLQGMDNLTDVSVSECGGMEHLFVGPPTVEQRNDVLSKLRSLRLSFLPSMTSIWPMGLVVKLENLTTLHVWRCRGLKTVLSSNQMTESIVRYYNDENPDKMKMTMPPSLPTVVNEEAPSIQGLPSVESSLQEVTSALRDENTKTIQVEVLSKEESWKLFRETAGDVVDDPSLHTKAMEVLKECAGLPLAIKVLGKTLRNEKDPRVWANALSQMKMSAPKDFHNITKEVYQSINISYVRLEDELKPLFLFCCLFPEDYDIHVDQMIHMWKGEGFLDDHESLEAATNRGHTWVGKLISSCLLLASTKEGHVKMHDIVRDVGIWISSNECKDYKSFVGIPQKGLSRGKNWEEYKRISLWRCGIKTLPEGMHCPRLLTLMMPENEELTEIQGWFWEATKELRVLDLSNTAISKIPLSPSNPVNLRVLCLRDCNFEEGNCLSALGGLKQLEFLDLSSNYRLHELPNEIGELVNLRSLDLTNTPALQIVPSGVISRLTLLEELKMWDSFHEWKAEEKDASSSSSSCNASLSEVASLKELSNLHLCIEEVERFPQDYPLIKHLTKLKNFCFCISTWHVVYRYLDSNADELRYMEIVGCSLIPEWALMLLPQTTQLTLEKCKGQEALNRGEGFPSLKYLKVEECDDVEFVVSAKESPENAFGYLQSLELRELPNLKKVVTKYEEGLLPNLLFRNLKKMDVIGCPELKHLLPSVLLQGMDNLTDVSVWGSEAMEHLFDGPPTVEQRNDVLSKLETLRLSFLPSMTSIWPMGLVMNLQKLATLDLWNCSGLKKSVVSAMQMKGGLPNLVELSVADRGGVEEIISDVVDNEGLLPKLEHLRLDSLPELVRIYGGGEAVPPPQLDWHSLKTIWVSKCPKLKKVQALEGGADSVPSLKEIKGERNWWEGLDWEGDERVITQFHSLFEEEVVALVLRDDEDDEDDAPVLTDDEDDED